MNHFLALEETVLAANSAAMTVVAFAILGTTKMQVSHQCTGLPV